MEYSFGSMVVMVRNSGYRCDILHADHGDYEIYLGKIVGEEAKKLSRLLLYSNSRMAKQVAVEEVYHRLLENL